MHVAPLLLGAALALLTGGTAASKILFLAPIAVKSHAGYFASIVTTLARHGHEMTYVTPFASNKETANIRMIVLPNLDFSPYIPTMFKGTVASGLKLGATFCADGLEDPKVTQLLNETFDLIIMPSGGVDCFLSFVHHFKVPFVMVIPVGLAFAVDDLVGNPSFPSYEVNLFYDAQPPLSFMMRAINIGLDSFQRILTYFFIIPLAEKESQARGLLPDDMPSLHEMRKKVSLILLNSYRGMEIPRPYVPTVIHAGGLHIHPPKPLPQDLEDWVQGAGDDGVIYFSLGSLANTSDMPENYRLAFIRGLGRLKQRVLWKWNSGYVEDLPPNVYVSKWLPQQDILAHPNVRLFISHGGIHSVQESVYHGVPIVGMPMFSDQYHNLGQGAREGWVHLLKWENLTEDTLVATVKAALNDPRLQESMKRKSMIIKDQPMSPEETVVYWIEYVIRHGGTEHLRCPAADMNWFFLYNYDVWITFFITMCLLFYLSFAMLRCTLRFCLKRCSYSDVKNKTE
ncbi:UDP-glucosyltransferase 2-like [Oratosquilla oratoria]|uniref:UDP-glucosyltransferase 2-like n=1 Tax=Oratosquilla oratoria TaxID=337810 RepID=UPI003F76FF4E